MTKKRAKTATTRPVGRRKFLSRSGAALGGAGLATLGFPAIVSGAKGEITLYAWYQVVFRKLIPEFEKETGIRVNNVGGYSKDDEWWAKVQTGESFDIIVPGGNRVPNGIAAGAFNKIDLSKIPNYANLFERVQKVPDFMKDGDHYVVPMSQVIYAMFYNTNHFAAAPESWYAAWDEAQSGKVIMNDRARQTIAIASLMLGDDPNNPTMWDETKELLKDQKKHILKYWSDHKATTEMLVREQAFVGMFTDGRIRRAIDAGAPVRPHIPKEGAMYLVDSLAIPSTAENPEEAHVFINWMLRPEISAALSETIFYDAMNSKAKPNIPPNILETFDLPNQDKMVILKDVPPATKKQLDELWLEVKLS